MSWVRIDDQFADHPKVRQVGAVGMAIQISALCYCNRFLTDGFVSFSAASAIVRSCLSPTTGDTLSDTLSDMHESVREKVFSPGAIYTPCFTSGMAGIDATELDWPLIMVNAGLWEPIDSGYLIHDYLEYNPSKAEVLERKEAASRGGKARQKISNTKGVTSSNTKGVTSSNTLASPNPVPHNTEPPESPNGDSVPNVEPRAEKPLPEPITTAVKIWNDAKAEAWDYVHDPRKTAGLITRLQAALKTDGFYLPEIIEKARGYPFLASKKFVTLRWLVSKSDKTGNLNAQDIMRGYYDNQTTKPERKQPGCLVDDGRKLW